MLRVGLASTPDTLGNLERCRAGLTDLGRTLGFELLVGERTLADLADAQTVAEQFAAQRTDLVLLLCNSFTPNGDVVLPLAATPARLGLWALPEPTRSGPLQLTSLVELNLFASVLLSKLGGAQSRHKWFWGEVSDPAFRQRFEVTIRALRAIQGLGHTNIGYIGGHAPGFENLAFDACALTSRLGVTVCELPLDMVLEHARSCAEEEAQAEGQRIARQASGVTCSSADLAATARIKWALQQVAQEWQLTAMAVSCWPGFYQALGAFPCVAYGTLNAQGTVVACEGDVMAAVTLLALAMAGDERPTLMDLVSILPEEDALCFWHCGLAAWNLADSNGVRLITRPVPQPDGGTCAVGGFAEMSLAPGPATIARIRQDGAQLLLASGQVTDRLGPGYEGSGGWVTALHMAHQRVTPMQFLDAVLRHGVEHHYAILPQDVTAPMLELAAWLDMAVIEPQQFHTHL